VSEVAPDMSWHAYCPSSEAACRGGLRAGSARPADPGQSGVPARAGRPAAPTGHGQVLNVDVSWIGSKVVWAGLTYWCDRPVRVSVTVIVTSTFVRPPAKTQ
jgi:hypothetical protein